MAKSKSKSKSKKLSSSKVNTIATNTSQGFVGTTGWAEPDSEVSVDRAILRSQDELVVDCVYEGQHYTATLIRRTGNEFRGRYITKSEGQSYEGNISCYLFTSDNGLFLFGRWYEDN